MRDRLEFGREIGWQMADPWIYSGTRHPASDIWHPAIGPASDPERPVLPDRALIAGRPAQDGLRQPAGEAEGGGQGERGDVVGGAGPEGGLAAVAEDVGDQGGRDGPAQAEPAVAGGGP